MGDFEGLQLGMAKPMKQVLVHHPSRSDLLVHKFAFLTLPYSFVSILLFSFLQSIFAALTLILKFFRVRVTWRFLVVFFILGVAFRVARI